MLTIPLRISSNRAALLIVLEDDNLARIKEYDPASVELNKMPVAFRDVRFTEIHVMYATPEEIQQVQELGADGKMDEALRILTRGWQYRPEQGDHDQAYISVKGGSDKSPDKGPVTYSGRAGEA